MDHIVEEYEFEGLICNLEYQHEKDKFYPIKIEVKFPIKNGGSELKGVIFSKIFFSSKNECVNFLINESKNFINKN